MTELARPAGVSHIELDNPCVMQIVAKPKFISRLGLTDGRESDSTFPRFSWGHLAELQSREVVSSIAETTR